MGIFDKAFRLSQTFSPIGLIGKAINRESIVKPPSKDAIKKGFGASIVGASAAVGVGSGLSDRIEPKEKLETPKRKNMGLIEKMQNSPLGQRLIGTGQNKPSGQIRFGSDSTQGFIPLLLAGALALAIAIGGGFVSFGKRKRRR